MSHPVISLLSAPVCLLTLIGPGFHQSELFMCGFTPAMFDPVSMNRPTPEAHISLFHVSSSKQETKQRSVLHTVGTECDVGIVVDVFSTLWELNCGYSCGRDALWVWLWT